ncbi:hypothetical protein R3P38DRAFT_3221253 [Favolaschia claudopus]|uniref:Uncharacterized protein n=1 Tax=Favolaschia claudopus TaxID=2862362 RepID=A0AAW0A1Z3_9AGAR
MSDYRDRLPPGMHPTYFPGRQLPPPHLAMTNQPHLVRYATEESPNSMHPYGAPVPGPYAHGTYGPQSQQHAPVLYTALRTTIPTIDSLTSLTSPRPAPHMAKSETRTQLALLSTKPRNAFCLPPIRLQPPSTHLTTALDARSQQLSNLLQNMLSQSGCAANRDFLVVNQWSQIYGNWEWCDKDTKKAADVYCFGMLVPVKSSLEPQGNYTVGGESANWFDEKIRQPGECPPIIDHLHFATTDGLDAALDLKIPSRTGPSLYHTEKTSNTVDCITLEQTGIRDPTILPEFQAYAIDHAIRDLQAYDPDGRRIPAADLAHRLLENPSVIVANLKIWQPSQGGGMKELSPVLEIKRIYLLSEKTQAIKVNWPAITASLATALDYVVRPPNATEAATSVPNHLSNAASGRYPSNHRDAVQGGQPLTPVNGYLLTTRPDSQHGRSNAMSPNNRAGGMGTMAASPQAQHAGTPHPRHAAPAPPKPRRTRKKPTAPLYSNAPLNTSPSAGHGHQQQLVPSQAPANPGSTSAIGANEGQQQHSATSFVQAAPSGVNAEEYLTRPQTRQNYAPLNTSPSDGSWTPAAARAVAGTGESRQHSATSFVQAAPSGVNAEEYLTRPQTRRNLRPGDRPPSQHDYYPRELAQRQYYSGDIPHARDLAPAESPPHTPTWGHIGVSGYEHYTQHAAIPMHSAVYPHVSPMTTAVTTPHEMWTEVQGDDSNFPTPNGNEGVNFNTNGEGNADARSETDESDGHVSPPAELAEVTNGSGEVVEEATSVDPTSSYARQKRSANAAFEDDTTFVEEVPLPKRDATPLGVRLSCYKLPHNL